MSFRTFKALAYRELYLSKKKLKPLLVIFVIMSVLSVLAILSFDYGNIGRIISDVIFVNQDKSDPALEAEIAGIKETVVLLSKLYPILLSGFAVATFLQSCEADEKGKWRYFFKSVPVTPTAKSAATFLLVVLMNVASFAVASLFCLFIGSISGIGVTYVDFALILAGIAAGDLFGVLLQIGIKLFHSLDKAGILLVSVAFAGVIGYNLIDAFSKSPAQHIEAAENAGGIKEILSAFSDWAIIAAPVIIAASVAVGFIANVLLYRRREK